MNRRGFLGASVVVPFALTTAACAGRWGADGSGLESSPVPPVSIDPAKAPAIDAMQRAVVFMDQKVSYQGAYVWAYKEDLSQCWGEMEAYRSMCWMQPTGTPSVGNLILDAYHAYGDEAFYQAAERTGLAMIEAQHPSGGWNYIHDFTGEETLKKWYETVGANGWRLEEFQHYYGNATFDDATTAVAAQFMLRMYLEKKDPRFKASLDKAIQFVIDSQFAGGIADGGWPQRWPVAPDAVRQMVSPNWPPTGPGWEHLQVGARNGGYVVQGPGGPGNYTGVYSGMEDGDYTRFVTFNDDVMGENIKFLMLCVTALGRNDLKPIAVRAMDCMHRLMYRYENIPGTPGHDPVKPAVKQVGWGLQHLSVDTVDAYGVLRRAGSPASARSYEPRGLATHTTQTNIQQLFNYFQLTGDAKYLNGLDEAIAWLAACPKAGTLTTSVAGSKNFLPAANVPTYMELETNRPRFVHRYGSNIKNGAYYIDYDVGNTLSHYGASRSVDPAALRAELDRLKALSPAQVAALVAASPLSARSARALPKYFAVGGEVDFPHLYAGAVKASGTATAAQAEAVIAALGSRNYWLSSVGTLTNPYTHAGPSSPYLGKEYMSKHVGDIYDTSPYGTALESGNSAGQMPSMPPYNDGQHVVPLGISCADFVNQMQTLIRYVAPVA